MAGGGAREVTVRCLLLLGDQAELVPDGWDGQGEPSRWPAAAIAAEAGLPAGELPGRRLAARATGGDGDLTFSGFRLL
jgi:hypothetical protein